jgi:outer membrane protein assembly factor BamE (lipoprotein component of BamABCDE complex)
MPLRVNSGRLAPLAAALVLALGLSACSGTGGFSSTRTQGYEISQDALAQIRVGQSQDLVTLVLGSPQTTNNFNEGTAWYYVETKVNETAFGLSNVQSRTVLAVYFDKNKKVSDTAVYGQKDGRVFAIEQRRTPSYGQDKNFIESIISSF